MHQNNVNFNRLSRKKSTSYHQDGRFSISLRRLTEKACLMKESQQSQQYFFSERLNDRFQQAKVIKAIDFSKTIQDINSEDRGECFRKRRNFSSDLRQGKKDKEVLKGDLKGIIIGTNFVSKIDYFHRKNKKKVQKVDCLRVEEKKITDRSWLKHFSKQQRERRKTHKSSPITYHELFKKHWQANTISPW